MEQVVEQVPTWCRWCRRAGVESGVVAEGEGRSMIGVSWSTPSPRGMWKQRMSPSWVVNPLVMAVPVSPGSRLPSGLVVAGRRLVAVMPAVCFPVPRMASLPWWSPMAKQARLDRTFATARGKRNPLRAPVGGEQECDSVLTALGDDLRDQLGGLLSDVGEEQFLGIRR
ncbi:hypothetical protein [Pseudonocardia sp. Ae707_Ps2]|uniref:hypothetical protein n=1 Tax=Pseudonocardia sp. Ae707_Ps2 TaxID=2212992 RepID=UPI00307FC2C6